MSQRKKRIRIAFREATLSRDGHRCALCGRSGTDCFLDPHHITDRNDMPNGGYVPENGISLCPVCHELAERHHAIGEADLGYAPADLYTRIGSSYEKAYRASEELEA